MRALVLSCSTGGGHNAAARAVVEALKNRNHEAEFLDYMSLGSKITETTVNEAYIKTVQRFPWLFGKIYQIGRTVSDFNADRFKSPVYFANVLLAEKLLEVIREGDYDVVVTSHLYPAEALTYLKLHGKTDVPTVAVATDYALIPFWPETACDVYTLPHRDCAVDYVSHDMDLSKLYVTGIPVEKKFNEALSMSVEEARRKIGIGAGGSVMLVVGGSMGSGDLDKMTGHLVRRMQIGENLIVVTGSNQALRRKLDRKYGKRQGVRILGYTDEMEIYMRASNVVFTKPGGLTTTEAAVMGVPIVHIKPIPGVEPLDRDFFTAHSMSVSGKNIKEQVENGINLIHHPREAKIIKEAMMNHVSPRAAEDIALLCEMLAAYPDRKKAIGLSNLFRPAGDRGEGMLWPPI